MRTRLPLLLVPASVLAGCADLGDRAENGCPVGETCSDETPEGLEFAGTEFGDSLLDRGVKPIAAGGTETIEVFDHATGRRLQIDYVANALGGTFWVDGQTEHRVSLVGQREGEGVLEVRDPDGLLLDRLAIETHAIARFRLVTEGLFTREDAEAPWEAWTGATARGVVMLQSAEGQRLADESMIVAGVAGGAEVERSGWDGFEVVVPEGGADLAIAAGARAEVISEELHIAASQQIDEAAVVAEIAENVHAGQSQLWCARAKHGDADLLFVPWTFTIEGPATRNDSWAEPGCVLASLDAAGTVTVTATAPGHEPVVATLDVLPATSNLRRGAADEIPQPTLGERASR